MILGRSYFKLEIKQALGPTGKIGGQRPTNARPSLFARRPASTTSSSSIRPWPIERLIATSGQVVKKLQMKA